jgi:hypothetical protein
VRPSVKTSASSSSSYSPLFIIIAMLIEGGHVDLKLRRKFTAGAVVDEHCPTFCLLSDGREGLAFLKRQFLCEGHKAGVIFG